MSDLAIAVRGLRKSFGTKEAMAGASLEIAAGSLGGLAGPNGAGKTTTLSMMTGLLRPGEALMTRVSLIADLCSRWAASHRRVHVVARTYRAWPLGRAGAGCVPLVPGPSGCSPGL